MIEHPLLSTSHLSVLNVIHRAKSCNKLLIGKTYWKSAALPAILHGSEVVCYTENQITKLQTEENKALRYTVNARKCTAISALRGDVGASLQATRDMKTKILFIKHILRDNNLLKEIFLQQYDNKKMYKMNNTNKEIYGSFANKYTHDRNI